MEFRRLLLKIMLWSLGFAAFSGVGAILISGGDITWRVVGTGLATAVACALLILMSKLMDKRPTALTGLLGMTAVVAEYIMCLLMIWEVIGALFGSSIEENVGLTMVFMVLVIPPAMYAGWWASSPRTERAGQVGLLVAAAVLLLVMAAIWLPATGETTEDSYESAGVLAIFGVLCVVALIGKAPEDPWFWRWLGLLCAVLAASMWLFDIWVGAGSPLGTFLFASLTCVAAVVAHANLCRQYALPPRQGWVQVSTLVAAILTAVFVAALVFSVQLAHFGVGIEEWLERLTGAAGILAGCGSLALIVLARLNRRVEFDFTTAEELHEIAVVCPRCARKQTLPVGEGRCAGCSLHIHTRLQDPRCPACGYLLYGLASGHCPECGIVLTAQN